NNCDRVPPPDCASEPLATGCPCLAGAVAECYPGKEGTRGEGLCRGGLATCFSRTWGKCVCAVTPHGRVCDGLDQYCGGIAENGVQSPCGGGNNACTGGVWGQGEDPFVAGPDTDLTAIAELTLRRISRDTPALWVPNTAENTVSKIDTRSKTEVARY